MFHTFFAAIVLMLMLAGCSSQRVLLTAAPGQKAIVRDGLPALISKKKHFVMLKPNKRIVQGNARPSFTIVLRNLGATPENLRVSSIEARQTIKGKQYALRVYSYDELVKEEQTRQTIAAVGTALAGVGRAYSAANAGYVRTTGSVNVYGSSGAQAYGNYSATTYDPLRAQLAQNVAQAQTNADFANLQSQGEANLSRLRNTILKDNTVFPGEWIGGSIVLDPPQSISQTGNSAYTILVGFAGEIHEFSITQAPN